MSLLTDVTARVYPVGRLDYNTSGLLILTNDGDLSYHLSHPAQKVWKTYEALIDNVISAYDLRKLETGVDIDGYVTKPAKARVLKEGPHRCLVELSISEGKNRQVRRMFKALGYNVMALRRVSIGSLMLGHLKEGTYRKLTQREIDYLKNC